MSEPAAKIEVLVIGGGYAGVLAANRLAARGGRRLRITLISDRDDLVNRIRLHEVAAGITTRRYPLATLLHRRVIRVRGRVVQIDAAARSCVVGGVAGESAHRYDYLVYAAGSGVAAVVPGARDHGGALASPESAAAFADRLRGLRDHAPVVVVGGGLTAIETAAEIAEAHARLRVTMVCEALAPGYDDATRAALRAGLDAVGVIVRTGVRVGALCSDAVVLADLEEVPAAAAVFVAGFAASPLARSSGLPVDAAGRLRIEETLQVLGHPEVLGCGDAVAVPAACVGTGAATARMACATAMPMGAHAADVIVDLVRGRPAKMFRFGYLGTCVSIGRKRGVVIATDGDDRPTGRLLTGRKGAFVKEWICRYVIGALRLERRVPGLYAWKGRWARRPALPDRTPAQLAAPRAEGDTPVA